MDISLVVCTRNRANQLGSALEAIKLIEFDGSWELVVVDNNSTDHTAAVMNEFQASAPFSMKIVMEARPGLAAARNCGIRHSQGALVVFTDDDCYPAPDHFRAIHNCMTDRTIAYCGGRVLLYDSSDLPLTIQTRNTPLDLPARMVVPSGLIHGANMAFRREALLTIEGFDERLGAGTYFRSGEDTDVLRRLSWAGFSGRYDPSICVFHHHGRKTRTQEVDLRQGYDRGVAAVFAKFCLYRQTRKTYLRHLYWHARTQPMRSLLRQMRFGFSFARRCGFSSQRAWSHPTHARSEDDAH